MLRGKGNWVRGGIAGAVALYLVLTLGVTRPILPKLIVNQAGAQSISYPTPTATATFTPLPNTSVTQYLSDQQQMTTWPWDIPGFEASYNANLALLDTTAGGNTTLTATSASLGGAALAPGACATASPAVSGAATTMVAVTSPVTYPGDAFKWDAYVSSAGVVSVRLCNQTSATATSTASTYRVRVLK